MHQFVQDEIVREGAVIVSIVSVMCLLLGCVYKRNSGFKKATFHSRSDVHLSRQQNFPSGVLCAEQLKYLRKDKGSASSSWVVEPRPSPHGSKRKHQVNSTKTTTTPSVSTPRTPSAVRPTITDTAAELLYAHSPVVGPAEKRKVSIKDHGVVSYCIDHDQVNKDEGFKEETDSDKETAGEDAGGVLQVDSGLVRSDSVDSEVYQNPSSGRHTDQTPADDEDSTSSERKVSPADSGMYSVTSTKSKDSGAAGPAAHSMVLSIEESAAGEQGRVVLQLETERVSVSSSLTSTSVASDIVPDT